MIVLAVRNAQETGVNAKRRKILGNTAIAAAAALLIVAVGICLNITAEVRKNGDYRFNHTNFR